MTPPPPAPQRWRTLVLVYPVLDARFGSGITRRRARRVMAREEREAVHSVLERLPATVLDWSSGLASLEPFDIIEVRRPVGSLSSSGQGRWWVGPREVRPELAEVAATGAEYDSVYALWPADPDVPQCGWGCTLGPSDATFGAGFSSISSDHWRTLLTDPDPTQGYVHEWLHQVEAVYPGARRLRGGAAAAARCGAVHLDAPGRRAAVRALVRRVRAQFTNVVALVSGLHDRAPAAGERVGVGGASAR